MGSESLSSKKLFMFFLQLDPVHTPGPRWEGGGMALESLVASLKWDPIPQSQHPELGPVLIKSTTLLDVRLGPTSVASGHSLTAASCGLTPLLMRPPKRSDYCAQQCSDETQKRS